MEFKIHNIHPYHGKFYSGIPRYFLEKYGKDAKYVLDPFCGSGTTLVECAAANINSVGVDINFLSCKISRAKTTKTDLQKLAEYESAVLACGDNSDIGFKDSTSWFTAENYDDLCKITNGISQIPDLNYKNIFEVILSSVLKTACNKRKVWNNGYIADNVLPNLPSGLSLRKTFINGVKKFRIAYAEFNKEATASSLVIESDVSDYNPDKLFDMIITSPPYPFAVDFAKYNRLSYYLFKRDLDKAVEDETGARSKRNKKNCVEEFFSEMEKLYLHITKLVKIGGYACMTAGNTQRNKKNIDFVAWLIRFFGDNGWELTEDTVRELKKQSMPQKRIPVEHVLVFKRYK